MSDRRGAARSPRHVRLSRPDDQALIAAQKYIAQQNQLASARDAIDPKDLEALTTFLPDSVDNVRLILDLNALAARSGISVMNIDVTANSTLGTKNAPVTPLSSVGSIDISLRRAVPSWPFKHS